MHRPPRYMQPSVAMAADGSRKYVRASDKVFLKVASLQCINGSSKLDFLADRRKFHIFGILKFSKVLMPIVWVTEWLSKDARLQLAKLFPREKPVDCLLIETWSCFHVKTRENFYSAEKKRDRILKTFNSKFANKIQLSPIHLRPVQKGYWSD